MGRPNRRGIERCASPRSVRRAQGGCRRGRPTRRTARRSALGQGRCGSEGRGEGGAAGARASPGRRCCSASRCRPGMGQLGRARRGQRGVACDFRFRSSGEEELKHVVDICAVGGVDVARRAREGRSRKKGPSHRINRCVAHHFRRALRPRSPSTSARGWKWRTNPDDATSASTLLTQLCFFTGNKIRVLGGNKVTGCPFAKYGPYTGMGFSSSPQWTTKSSRARICTANAVSRASS